MTSGNRLNNKIGLITGAARGIGEGIARAMAAQGALLYLADLDLAGAQSVAQDIGATAIPLNVTSETDWEAVADTIRREHGHLDILVNNAGTEVVKSLEKLSLAEIRLQLAVNLEGPMLGCRAFLPLLSEAGRLAGPAAVINIASVAGLRGQPDLSVYSVSKAAVGHLATTLAVEWAKHGHRIRVNAIYPGCIQTPMLEEAVNGWVRENILTADSAWENMRKLSPMNEIGETSDIAMGAVYLASDEAKFVTGTSLVIDGGWTAG